MFASLRPLHWTKNLLLFVPLLLAHRREVAALLDVAIAFAAFCLAASGTYLINDLCDAGHDRQHPAKRDRLVASGKISGSTAIVAGTLLVLAGLGVSLSVAIDVAMWLTGYCALTLAYSLLLKRRVFLDVLALALLYTIRLLAGGVAGGVEVSDWLLALSFFLFVSLALLKRYADLRFLAAYGGGNAPGRDYDIADIDLLRSMGVASGYLSVLVLALYLNGAEVTRLYGSPRLLWLVCPMLLYWIAHMWFLAHRGRIEDDPIVVAARDPVSYVVGVLIIIVTAAAV